MKSSQTLIALGKFGMPAGGLAAMGFGLAASLTTLIWATGDLNAGLDPADYARRDAKARTDHMRLAQRADDGRPRDPNYGGAAPPGYDGVTGAVQDWLARSNRAYQGIIIKGLSRPPEGAAADEIARKIEETKEEAARAAASPANDEAARKAAETMVREAAENADAARKAVEAKAAAEAAKKAADAKPTAEADAKVKPVKREPPKTPTPSPEPAEEVAAKAEAQRLANEREEKTQRAAEERRQAEAQSRRFEDEKRKAEAEARRLGDEKRKAEARIAEERARAAEADRQKADEAERRAAAEQERSKAAAEADRQKADEAERQAAAERERSKATAAERAADVDQSTAPTPTERRTIRLTTEPIPRPRPTSVMYRPELASPRAVRVAGNLNEAPVRRRPQASPRVKRWAQRDGGSVCRGAGRRIKPPGRYVVANGDSLWDISARHYRLGRLYPRIYRANRRIVSDPDLIYPCQKLRVPRRRV